MSYFLHLVGFFPFLLFIEKNRISLFYAKECDTSHKVLDLDSFIANFTLKNRKNHYDVKLLQDYRVIIYLVVLKQNKRNLRLSFLEIISYKANIILCWTLKINSLGELLSIGIFVKMIYYSRRKIILCFEH